jgi:hypothetical protein
MVANFGLSQNQTTIKNVKLSFPDSVEHPVDQYDFENKDKN